MKVMFISAGHKTKLSRILLLRILGASYFGFMILFGIVYWMLANYSWGDFFIFQEDVHINTMINAFKREAGISNGSREFNEHIVALIRKDEAKRMIARINMGRTYIISLDGELGDNWAEYYYHLLIDNGVTHIGINKVEDVKLLGKYDTHKLQIGLYKSKIKDSVYELAGHKNSEGKNFKLMRNIEVWVLNYSELVEGFLVNGDYYFYPMDYSFKNVMKKSVTFLDNSPDVLEKVVRGRFRYPVWDFLYFSTVTITTLGYGDILPNSTLVRVLVMVESMLGVIIIGAFVSCMFWK